MANDDLIKDYPTSGPGCGAVLAFWVLVAVVAGIVTLVEVLF